MPSKLIDWRAEVLIDPEALPANRPGLRYQLVVSCPDAGCSHQHIVTSPTWHLVDKIDPVKPAKLEKGRMKYQMTIRDKATSTIKQVIEWAVLRPVGHETVRLIEDLFDCRCGMVFRLTPEDQERLKIEVTERVTLDWLEAEIRRLEAELKVAARPTQRSESWQLLAA